MNEDTTKESGVSMDDVIMEFGLDKLTMAALRGRLKKAEAHNAELQTKVAMLESRMKPKKDIKRE